MIEELQKRPFARPLLLWIVGICLYVFLPFQWLASSCLGGLVLLLLLSRKEIIPEYRDRWQWGVFFALLLILTAVLLSAWNDRSDNKDSWISFLLPQAAALRQSLLSRLEALHLDQNSRDVLGAMLLGDTTTLDREIRMQFSITGVAHILSVSGFHVAVICGFFSFLLKPLPSNGVFRWIKYMATMLLLWGFTLVSGLAPPSVRSALMLSFFLTGQVINRSTDGYNTLAASAFIMLVYNPFYLFDIGFQLSYIAVWFILLLHKPLEQLLDVRNPLLAEPYGWIVVSVAAQAGTSFLCMYYFSQFPTLFLLTNLPFSFVSMLLLPVGLVYMLLPPSFPGINFLGWLLEQMMTFLMYIVESFSIFPWATFIIPFDIWDLILAYLSLFLLVFFIYRKRPLYLLLACSFAALLLVKLLIEALWLPAI